MRKGRRQFAKPSPLVHADRSGQFGLERKRWSDAEKKAIVTETYRSSLPVAEIAKRHGVSSVSVYMWRKQFGSLLGALDAAVTRGRSPDAPQPAERASNRPAPGAVRGALHDTMRDEEIALARIEREIHLLTSELNHAHFRPDLFLAFLASVRAELRLLVSLYSGPPRTR